MESFLSGIQDMNYASADLFVTFTINCRLCVTLTSSSDDICRSCLTVRK